MDPRRVLTRFDRTYATWRASLAGQSEEGFDRKRAAGGWTLGQVCDHVTATSQAFLDGAEALLRGEGEKRGRSLLVTVMTGIGSFPPFRFKVPPDLPDALQRLADPDPLTKARALERFSALERRTHALCEVIAAAPRELRSQHPAAGWVNAREWYQLSEMHLRHHLRQLHRIEKELQVGATTGSGPSGRR
ncbi:MAG: DinB family protein [Planctomycetota bacterium]|jgi:hypothetical protein